MAKQKIFDNELVETLVIEWKRTKDGAIYQRVCKETTNLIDAIIRSNGFYRQMDFNDIRNNVFVELISFIDKWDPGRGTKLYSYLSTCIRNACISTVRTDAENKKRHVYTDVSLDTLGDSDNVSMSHNYSTDEVDFIRSKAHMLECRWKEPIIRAGIQYLVECHLSGRNHRKREIIRSLCLGYKMPQATSKFLFDWTTTSLRAELLSMYDSPLGDVDLLRLAEKFSHLPDMINLIGYPAVKKLLAVFSGVQIRFPSLPHIKKLLAARAAINSRARTPDEMMAVSNAYKLPVEKIEETIDTVSRNIVSGLLHDTPLYGEEEEDEDSFEEGDRNGEMNFSDRWSQIESSELDDEG